MYFGSDLSVIFYLSTAVLSSFALSDFCKFRCAVKFLAPFSSDTFILEKVSNSHKIQLNCFLFDSRIYLAFDHANRSGSSHKWILRSGSAFLHSPVAPVNSAASLLVLGEAAVTRRRQLLGILGRARHVLCIQAVHGANPPRLGLRAPAVP